MAYKFVLKNIKIFRAQAEDAAIGLPELVMKAGNIAANIMHGEHVQRKSGIGDNFRQYRHYQDSDRPQDVDWRQSAKNDAVFVKQREMQTTIKTYLWCARGRSMDFKSTQALYSKQDCARILTLSLALLTRKAKEHIGLIDDMKIGKSDAHITHIAHSLLLKNAGDFVLPHVLGAGIPRHAAFFGIGDFLSPLAEIEQAFAEIAARTQNAFIIQTLDPYELDLSYTGRVRFEGLDKDDHFVINHVPSVRDAYKARIEAHIAEVKALCTRYNWLYISHRTDHDIRDTLQNIWAMATYKGSA